MATLFTGAVFLSGCNIDSVNNNIQRYIGGNKDAINQAEEAKNSMEDYNPIFTQEEEADTQDPIAKQVNQLLKNSLGNVFSDSKLISIQNEGKTPFIMKYIAKRRINQADGDSLHSALVKSESRIKNDAVPNYIASRNTVEFSVYHDFGGRSYILATVLDLAEQAIWVNVY